MGEAHQVLVLVLVSTSLLPSYPLPPFLPPTPLLSHPYPTPTISIMNDVILNRRVTILDKEALIDAKRSLSVMLNDFLQQHKPKLTENERKRLARYWLLADI